MIEFRICNHKNALKDMVDVYYKGGFLESLL